MRLVILSLIMLIIGTACSQALALQNQATVAPPVHSSETAKDSDEPSNICQQQHSLTVSFPPNINITVSGKLDAVSNITQHNAEEKNNERFSELFNAKITDYVTAAFTVAIAFFTFGLMRATIGLFKSTTDLVRSAEDTAEKQLRAYVSIKGGSVSINNAQHSLDATVEIINSGQTPGYDVRIWKNMEITDSGAIFDFSVPQKRAGEVSGIIGAKSQLNIIQDLAFSSSDLQAVMDKSKTIRLWGRIDYLDAFGVWREYIFRFSMNGPPKDFQIGIRKSTGWALKTDPKGHEAD